jgi:hypothetical protein
MTLLLFLVLFLLQTMGCSWRSAFVGVPAFAQAFATILLLLTALHLLLMLAAPTNTVVPTVAFLLVFKYKSKQTIG